MAILDLLAPVHRATARDYRERVCDHDKAACAEVAARFERDYWDGDRRYGYGGYRYDGRWRAVADALAAHYGLRPGMRVLDVGCGKAHLLHDLAVAVPGLEVVGVDPSAWALTHTLDTIRPRLVRARAEALPLPDAHFDLVISLNTLHNLRLPALAAAVGEIGRVGRGRTYVVVESWRNEREKANLLAWQLTCAAFHDPDEWQWLLAHLGYQGDLGFIFFE